MAAPDHLDRGGYRLAYRRVKGWGVTVMWLGGFRSDMLGTKAEALAHWAEETGRAFVRFDYFGHGESDGAFEDGTIGRWCADALAVIDTLTRGPVILVGSSMGGWLACLVAQARPKRVRAMVLIAPAADFTCELMEKQMPAEACAELAATGVWSRPSDYGEPYPITQRLIEEGREHAILSGSVEFKGPVRILQGGEDPDVPWRHALLLAEVITSPDLTFTLIKDGDHRLSRPQDLARLTAAVAELA